MVERDISDVEGGNGGIIDGGRGIRISTRCRAAEVERDLGSRSWSTRK